MNISAKLKLSASKSATSPSCKTLQAIVKNRPQNIVFKSTTIENI
jgi:hypothetical protein